MSARRVALLPGDGIGPEVADAAVEVLNALVPGRLEFTEHPFGGASIDAHGTALTDAVLAACEQSDAVLLAAVGGPKWDTTDPGKPRPEQGLLGLRKALGLFANLRPVTAIDALLDASPLRREIVEGTDMLVVRELTGGIYFGEKTRTATSASDECRYSVEEVERIARVAFSAAKARVTSVDKANVLETSRLWREVVHRVHSEEFPNVQLEHAARGFDRDEADHRAAPFRGDPHREHVRRHPQRRGVGHHRLARPAPEREHRQPGRPGPVRARPRLRAGHCGAGCGQPARDVPVGRDDAPARPRSGIRRPRP